MQGLETGESVPGPDLLREFEDTGIVCDRSGILGGEDALASPLRACSVDAQR